MQIQASDLNPQVESQAIGLFNRNRIVEGDLSSSIPRCDVFMAITPGSRRGYAMGIKPVQVKEERGVVATDDFDFGSGAPWPVATSYVVGDNHAGGHSRQLPGTDHDRDLLCGQRQRVAQAVLSGDEADAGTRP